MVPPKMGIVYLEYVYSQLFVRVAKQQMIAYAC